jgi:hypothetical protein
VILRYFVFKSGYTFSHHPVPSHPTPLPPTHPIMDKMKNSLYEQEQEDGKMGIWESTIPNEVWLETQLQTT